MKIVQPLVASAILALSTMASAGVVDVAKIKITSTAKSGDSAYLQVAEVIATEFGTGQDLALSSAGATTSIHSQYGSLSSWGPHLAIDGNNSHIRTRGFYHGNNSADEFLQITLDAPAHLESISIYGRIDCCSTRDIYNLELIDSKGNQLLFMSVLNANNPQSLVHINLPNIAPILEPSTLGLMFGGLGLVGLLAWRSKNAATTA